jgi:hypothetical protein
LKKMLAEVRRAAALQVHVGYNSLMIYILDVLMSKSRARKERPGRQTSEPREGGCSCSLTKSMFTMAGRYARPPLVDVAVPFAQDLQLMNKWPYQSIISKKGNQIYLGSAYIGHHCDHTPTYFVDPPRMPVSHHITSDRVQKFRCTL